MATASSQAITDIDPNLVFSLRSVSDYVDGPLKQERIVAMLSGFFGALAWANHKGWSQDWAQ